jgi:hypothetical protein
MLSKISIEVKNRPLPPKFKLLKNDRLKRFSYPLNLIGIILVSNSSSHQVTLTEPRTTLKIKIKICTAKPADSYC